MSRSCSNSCFPELLLIRSNFSLFNKGLLSPYSFSGHSPALLAPSSCSPKLINNYTTRFLSYVISPFNCYLNYSSARSISSGWYPNLKNTKSENIVFRISSKRSCSSSTQLDISFFRWERISFPRLPRSSLSYCMTFSICWKSSGFLPVVEGCEGRISKTYEYLIMAS